MRVDRYEAPNYLAKYRERQNRKVEETSDDGTPLYLRRFRAKGAEVPVETVDGESFTRDYAASTREKEIVALVADGLSNSDIAAALTISHATVKTHVSRAMTKLGARDRAQLVALAYRHHLVEPPGRADRV